MQLTQNQRAGTQPIFLLRIDYYGVQLGFSSYPLDYEGQEYTGGLIDFQLEEQSDLLGVNLEANSFACAVHFPGLDMVREWRRGRGLEGIEAVVSYVLSKGGEILQDSEQILLTGIIQQPIFGDPEMHSSFASFSVEKKPFDSGKAIIDADEVIDKIKFPHLDEETASGKFYPTIIGRPGITRDGETEQVIYSTPAYNSKKYDLGSPAHDVYFIVSGHETEATTVHIWDGTKTPISKTILQGQDVNGRKYGYVNMNSEAFLYPGYTSLAQDAVIPSSFWVSWTAGGGKRNPFGSGILEGGGDICRWALMQAGIPLDHGAWANTGVILNQYKFAGYINEPINSWEWLQEYILPYLPIEIREGEKGLYPILAQYVAFQELHPVAEIIANPDFLQTGAIETATDTSDIVNACTVSFALNSVKDSYMQTIRIAPQAENTDGDSRNNFAQSSYNKYGLHEIKVEIPFIYERKTAHRVASDLIRASCFPKRNIEYCASAEYGNLKIGDVVKLTDENLYLEDIYCTVVRKAWEETKWFFTLQFEDTPVLISRDF